MPHKCFFPGCKTGYNSDVKYRKKNGLKSISLFKAPTNPELLEQWSRVIPRKDKPLTHKEFVCALHFKEEDIESFFEEKMPDGTIWRLQRDRIVLKKGAVPSLYPNLPPYCSILGSKTRPPGNKRKRRISSTTKNSEKQKRIHSEPNSVAVEAAQIINSDAKTSQSKKSILQEGKENILMEAIIFHPIQQSGSDKEPPNSVEDRENIENEQDSLSNQNDEPESPNFGDTSNCNEINEENSGSNLGDKIREESHISLPNSVLEEQSSFNFFKMNANLIVVENSWWKLNVLEDFVAFIRWTSDGTIEKRIVIYKDFTIKVFLKDFESDIGKDLKILSIEAISKLICKVERLQICSGVGKRDRECIGYLQPLSISRIYKLCVNCIKWKKEEKIRQKKRLKAEKCLKTPPYHVELLKFNLDLTSN